MKIFYISAEARESELPYIGAGAFGSMTQEAAQFNTLVAAIAEFETIDSNTLKADGFEGNVTVYLTERVEDRNDGALMVADFHC
jgi:hypothetical protein